jgi:hypothetical protein
VAGCGVKPFFSVTRELVCLACFKTHKGLIEGTIVKDQTG